MRLRLAPVALLLAAIGSACGSSSSSSGGPTPPVPVASVTATVASSTVSAGLTTQASAVLKDASGNVLTGRSVVWSATPGSVATVSASGLVTTVSAGTATITATSEGQVGTASLTVTAKCVATTTYDVTALAQTAPPGTAVIQPPAVRVTDATGGPCSGVAVTFSVTVGGGSVVGSPAITDATGVARLASWTFGPAGAQGVTATTTAVPGTAVEFDGLARPASTGYDITLRIVSPMSDSQLRAFVAAKERIQEFVVGDIPDQRVDQSAGVVALACGVNAALNETVDDVIIFAEVSSIDGVGQILGQAGPCYLRNGTPGFPVVGHMQFDTADLAALEAGGALEATVLHEMLHVLGFGTLWDTPMLVGAGTSLPYFAGAQARAAFVTYNGGGTYPGSPVPVEGSTGSPGTDDSHWRESDFDDELMTGFLDRGVPEPVSATTIASMQDLGYTVDLALADPFRWGDPTVALRRAVLRAVQPPFHLVDDVRRTPPVVLGPDGRPLFP